MAGAPLCFPLPDCCFGADADIAVKQNNAIPRFYLLTYVAVKCKVSVATSFSFRVPGVIVAKGFFVSIRSIDAVLCIKSERVLRKSE